MNSIAITRAVENSSTANGMCAVGSSANWRLAPLHRPPLDREVELALQAPLELAGQATGA